MPVHMCDQVPLSKSLDRFFFIGFFFSQKAVVQFLPSSDVVIRMSPLYLIPKKDVPLYIIVVYQSE